jgi:hypothetical protein
MPKAKNKITPAEQRKRFEGEVRKRIDAGELSPTEADAALDKLVRRSRSKKGT